MTRFVRLVLMIVFCLSAGLMGGPAAAQQNAPAVLFESMMDSYFGADDGTVSFVAYDVAFAPKGPAKAVVAIVNAKGKVLAQHPVLPRYKVRDGVFARMMVKDTPAIKLTAPGLYTMVFVMNGKPISRFPFVLKQTGAGKDPFDPKKTYVFDGHWRKLAHITTGSWKRTPVPVFSIWLGGVDMAKAGKFQEFFEARLYHNGKLRAHSRRQTSSYGNGHFKRRKVWLCRPHTEKQSPNAIPFTMKELRVDGSYELRVTRHSDKAKLRDFKFTVAKGKIRPLARARLGFKPASDFIVPRVTKKGSTAYTFVPATWIGSK